MSNDATASGQPASTIDIDPDVLRRKYAEERAKRLRSDGIGQFREPVGPLAHFLPHPQETGDDPVRRNPITKTVEVFIIGCGFGGLLAAGRLHEAGITDIWMTDTAGDFGGAWYWNRYPGAQCDIESYIYMPMLEETGYMPTLKYAYQPEIFAHAQRLGRRFDLYDKVSFRTQTTEARWDDDAAQWVVRTDRGDTFRSQFVIMSTGLLNRPKLPAIPGIEDFRGKAFHTSRWDYSYTGGSTSGSLDRLRDKRVGLIGTGATGIQCVPALGLDAEQLYVFQRTPSSVAERGQRPTDSEWASKLQPGWQQERNHNLACILSGVPVEVDLINDGWTELFKILGQQQTGHGSDDLTPEQIADMQERADFTYMEKLRQRVAATVENPATAEALKAWYGQWCKRPVFNDAYLDTFNRPNVELVDTAGKGVERITEDSVVVGGIEYPVDCLIFASGFEVGTTYTRRSACEMYGRDGQALSDAWKDGMRTYQGVLSHGFPNLMHIGFVQSGFSPNYTYVTDNQARHIAYLLSEVRALGARSVEASAESEQRWVDIVTAPSPMTKYQAACTPGYYNGEGQVDDQAFLETFYPDGCLEFLEVLDKWRADGRLEGLIVR